ncbi:CDP-6-deoxy-L-threo-D-glycero-4-hexulose-3-dehyd rase reductase [Aromatoleum aromaticum EbN1]|uniref:CDP-6-deoxy-L-threo-D-glycero-4-hexulose-3-dehyd rase reductase n=1 Tax=Aromatoleum aromaticum (strain DSM 19018 / LMG 30748 / EbN1) TaxID=76114 RepID=Q5P6H3_AROAE|nr:CDP-6-deoxy-delta-3,4-glucoseen reductase [Aromatoleum aromaticum]CAI07088.1 CDP-6-deoxy-L-threo-D-glycero-4-hexulose-3-dehyd rase reductase [Aromatoleum aromaticum EbN1]
MPFQISLEPGGQRFTADDDQTILEAALAAGLLLPYGCRDGACGACKGRVLSGEVDIGEVSASALPDAERAAGLALFCRARARSDLVLEARNVRRASDIPVRKLPCRVQRLRRAAPDVMIVDVKLPASETFRFHAGQYIDFILAGGGRRSFSIANAPDDADHLELHVRHVPGGQFTEHVFNAMKERDILRFEGPLGSFGLREDSTGAALLIVGGTGFAPIKSIVEHAIRTGERRPMTLYWGARDRAGLYLDDLARSWESTLPGFRYVPVLSESGPDDSWSGRTGLVHHAVMQDLPDLSVHEVYACGAPAMIDAARRDLVAERHLREEAFFSDAFTFASGAGR